MASEQPPAYNEAAAQSPPEEKKRRSDDVKEVDGNSLMSVQPGEAGPSSKAGKGKKPKKEKRPLEERKLGKTLDFLATFIGFPHVIGYH